ncbi:UvrD-helicase domain-containing protein [soil metagenome]
MLNKNFLIYRSSAGSGKTYTLAREYLKLSLKNPDQYRYILAVTFTNKATQEMKSRILDFLYSIASGRESSMKNEIKNFLSLDEQEIRARAKDVLERIIHDYSHFSISTIDSFFQKIIWNFAKEIGLQSGFKLELDQDKVLSEVVEMVLEDISKDNSLKNWLIKFAGEKVDEGQSWDIRENIKQLGKELFKESFKSIEKDLADLSSNPNLISEYLGRLKAVKSSFELSMRNLGSKACSIMKEHNLEVKDFSYGKSGVMGYLENICANNKYSYGARVKQAFQSRESWHTKSSPKKEIINKAVEEGIFDALSEVLILFEKEYKKYQAAIQILKFIYTFGVLSHINRKIKDYSDQNDLLLISDATAFLKEIIAENEAPFIYEKTGSTYKHFLIDEFQDTSGFQWANFRPLLINSIAEGHPNLVVGDIKQSIYRWRGGDWKLLLEQISSDIGEEHTQILNLNTNWRSKKNIIDFNNSLFNTAPQILVKMIIDQLEKSESLNDETLKEELLNQAQNIIKAYDDVYQQLPAPITSENFCGYVNMTFFESEEKASDSDEEEESIFWKQQIQARLPKMIEEIQDQGYSLKDVAILVRNSQEGREIASSLLKYKSSPEAKPGYSYEVISAESLLISGAISPTLLVNALKFLNNSENIIAKVHLAYDYQKYILKKEDLNLHRLFEKASSRSNKELEELLPENFLVNFGSLSQLPLYELVEELVRIFRLNQLMGEITFTQAFQDLVLTFTKDEKPDINSFLEYWEEKGCKTSVLISEKLDAIKILTIHKSKGLQYKVVIIPFCNWNIDHKTKPPTILWSTSNVFPFNEMKYLPLQYSSSLEDTVYQKAYFEEMMKAQIDNLNLLYVAFTRAEECLYVFGQKPKINKKGSYGLKCMSSLLYYIFTAGYLEDKIELKFKKEYDYSNLSSSYKAEVSILEIGDQDFKCSNGNGTTEPNSSTLSQYISEPWRERLKIRSRAKDFFNAESRKKINYGILLHQVLAKIKTTEDIPKVLQDFYFMGEIDQEDLNLLNEQIFKILEHEQVKQWYTNDWEVMTEAPVLPQSGDIKRFDRVMIKDKKAIVVDFKSGIKSDFHQKQVFDYVDLLNQMQYSPVEGYLVYLADGSVERVV